MRCWLFALVVLLFAAPPALADEETRTLQQRLTDADCYHGALDGKTSAALNEALKACPDMRPFLRIETHMHVANIWRVGVDSACRRLATSSEDKTVRIWSLPDGRLEQTIRLPIGDGNAGKVFAAALSPDGRTLAAGGWDGIYPVKGSHSLYLVDLASGAVRRVGAMPAVILAIAWSADASKVAVGLGKDGVRVFEAASGREAMSDSAYGGRVYGLEFGADGVLFSASYDGFVRRYSKSLALEAKSGRLPGKEPFGIALRPDGSRLAIGFFNEPKMVVLDTQSLKVTVSADTSGIENGDLPVVAWSKDGTQVAAGGTAQSYSTGAWKQFVRRFDADGKKLGADAPAAASTIQDLRACGNGFIFASGEPSFGFIGANGAARTLQGPRVADVRGKLGGAFTVSADAARVRFGLAPGDVQPVLYDLAAATLADSPRAPSDLAPARVEGLPVKAWKDTYHPTFGGAAIALSDYEASHALALRSNGQGFALGTSYSVRAFDASGHPLWNQAGPGEVWGLNYASNDKVLVAAYGDGTIRWLRASDGLELLAMFVESQSRKWVAWTPSGYYMASAGGEDLIGWHLNRGWTQLADFYPASRFAARFNRPDIVQRVLTTLDEAEAAKQANAAANRKPESAQAVLPPVATLVSPGDGAGFSGETIDVQVDIRSPSGAPIDRVEALIDGRPAEARGLQPTGDGTRRKLTVAVPAHDIQLSVIAHAGQLASEAATVRLHYTGGVSASDALKPKLYIVAIGVSDYAEEKLRLGWAAEDARGFSDAMTKQKGGLYADVIAAPPLVDRAVTRASVISALRWLRKQVTSRDTGMVLIAGHGTTDDAQNYWFLPSDASLAEIDAAGVSQDDLLRELKQVAGKAILFLDTCHANQAVANGVAKRGVTDIDGVVNEFARSENGLVVFSSSRGRETSQESAAWRHGAFTKALIEGLGEGKADLLHNGAITLSELDVFVEDRVKALTDGQQHPVMVRPPTMPDFAFAVAK